MQKRVVFLGALCLLITSCKMNEEPVPESRIDWQGHRGARGVYPENTWPAFQYALENGMKTLEMDVVITADQQVVLSHEPFLSHEICLDSNGSVIIDTAEQDYNIFRMTYEELQQYDCGSKPHPRFPQQKKMKVTKPLLADIISQAEAFKREAVFYNIEVKSQPERDSIYYPSVQTYTDLVVDVISRSGVFERTTLQSFDHRCLQYAHRTYPELKLALLVEENPDFRKEIEVLGFTPNIYSCYYPLVNEDLAHYAHQNNIEVIPWTVNDKEQIQKLIQIGVDGIITDYPQLKAEVN